MSKKRLSPLAIVLLCTAVLAGIGVISVDAVYAQTEQVNAANVQSNRSYANAISPSGSTYLVKFKSANGRTTWAIYRKVKAFGSDQFMRISLPVETSDSASQPDVSIDPDLEKEADDATPSLWDRVFSGGGEGFGDGNEGSNLSAPDSGSLTFPPNAVIVIGGGSIGKVSCDPACTGGF